MPEISAVLGIMEEAVGGLCSPRDRWRPRVWKLFVPICPSIYLLGCSICLSVCLCIYVIYQSVLFISMSMYLSVSILLSLYLPIFLPNLPTYPSIHLPTCLPIYRPTYLSIYVLHTCTLYITYLLIFPHLNGSLCQPVARPSHTLHMEIDWGLTLHRVLWSNGGRYIWVCR